MNTDSIKTARRAVIYPVITAKQFMYFVYAVFAVLAFLVFSLPDTVTASTSPSMHWIFTKMLLVPHVRKAIESGIVTFPAAFAISYGAALFLGVLLGILYSLSAVSMAALQNWKVDKSFFYRAMLFLGSMVIVFAIVTIPWHTPGLSTISKLITEFVSTNRFGLLGWLEVISLIVASALLYCLFELLNLVYWIKKAGHAG